MNTPTRAMLWLVVLQLFGSHLIFRAHSQSHVATVSSQETMVQEIRQAFTEQETVSLIVENGTLSGAKKNEFTSSEFVETLKFLGSSKVQPFKHIPYAVVEVDKSTFEAIISSPLVSSIQENRIDAPQLVESAEVTGAAKAWSMGSTGAGQALVVIDTGVDGGHPFLNNSVVAEACFSTTYVPSSASYSSQSLCPNGRDEDRGTGAAINCDPGIAGCDHGTRVAGILAGEDETMSGIAPDADIIAIQVFSRFEGYCGSKPCARSWASDQIAALEHVYDMRNDYKIAAVNLSLGGGHYTSPEGCDSVNPASKAIINKLREAGIAVIAASGNGGHADGMVAPACMSNVISVGSTSKSDDISSFSSSASFLDLLAPGQNITTSMPGGGFRAGSGTSFAAPHVAGAFAILRSRNPNASVDEILATLLTTGEPLTDNRNQAIVSRIQIDAAVESVTLPVELSFFHAEAREDGTVELQWETSSEQNNAGFEIEHAVGETYEVIGYREGNGTTVTPQFYSFLVYDLPPGQHRFRLRQIDFDGAFRYSDEVTIEIGLFGTHYLGHAYPNPFNPLTNFTLTVSRDQFVSIEVFNLLGERVAQLYEGEIFASEARTFTFEAYEWPSGMYLIQATGESFRASRTVTLLK